MRIVICSTLYPPIGIGGAERSVQFLSEALVERGHDVTVLSQGVSWRRSEEVIRGVRVVRTTSPPGFTPNVFAHRGIKEKVLSRLFRPWKPHRSSLFLSEIHAAGAELVHTNSVGGLEDLWIGCADSQIPVVHTLRNHASLCPRRMFVEGRSCESQCVSCVRRTASRHAAGERLSGIVGISDYILQEHLTSGYFRGVGLRTVIPNSYAAKGVSSESRSIGAEICFGYLGRIHETKGVKELIGVASKFVGRARFLIAGTGNPALVRRLQAEAPANVEFLGFSEAEAVLSRVDALVVPSLWREPFGRIYAESMVHGVPVVGSVHGAGRELVNEGITGWLCNPQDPADLERGIERAAMALLAGGAFREACLQAGAQFATDSVAAAYESFYARALEVGPVGAKSRKEVSLL